MSFRESLAETIKEKRPKITESSVKTYVSILFNLCKNMKGDEEVHWFDKNEKEILEFLKDKEPNKRKTILSALFILTNNVEFRTLMIEDCKVVNDDYKNQKMNTKQQEAWISTDDIQAKYNELLEKVKLMFAQKTMYHYNTIMEYLLAGLLGGCSGLIPRRSLDYGQMKVKNYDVKTDNYYKQGKFYFNIYKTAGKYGLQMLDVKETAPELNMIIKKWIKVNPTDYLLFSSNNNPLSSPQINRILNKVFGGKVSTDILRHVFITNKYGHMPKILDMQNTATSLGNSISTMMEYIKHE